MVLKKKGMKFMKRIRMISCVLVTALITSTVSMFPVIAETDEIVYTYTNEEGEIVNITQSELDQEHWNTVALGDTAPVVYKKFPASMNPYVDDLSNLSLEIRYMKNINENDNCTISIKDVYSDK